MPEIEGSRVTSETVFTPEYWGDYDAVAPPENQLSPIPVDGRSTAVNLIKLTLETALQTTMGTQIPDGRPVDLNNPAETGQQNLNGSVFLLDRESLWPFSSHFDTALPRRPSTPNALTVPPRSLIKARNDFSDDGRKVTVRRGEVTFTNGASVYSRVAGVMAVIGDKKGVKAAYGYPALALKLMRNGRARPARGTSLPRPSAELFYRHEIGRTAYLPGGVLSRLRLVEVLAVGETVEAKDPRFAKGKLSYEQG